MGKVYTWISQSKYNMKMLSRKWLTEASSETAEGALQNQLARSSIQQMCPDSFPDPANTQSGHGGKNGGYTRTQHRALPSAKPDLAIINAECPPPPAGGQSF